MACWGPMEFWGRAGSWEASTGDKRNGKGLATFLTRPRLSPHVGAESQAWGGSEERDAFQVSDGGGVMSQQAQVRGRRRGISSSSVPCTPFLLPAFPLHLPSLHCPPVAPHPNSGKKLSSLLLRVANSSQVRIRGFAGYLCVSSAPPSGLRAAFLLPSSPLSSQLLSFFFSLFPVSVAEMAALAGPNIYVYHNFRDINLTA